MIDYTLVLMDDTRDWLSRTRDQLLGALPQPPAEALEFVDTDGLGYTQAMRGIWHRLTRPGPPYVLFWEADFTPAGQVPLHDMAAILDADHTLAQVALLRQPWFGNEREHGGLIPALEALGQTFTHVDEPVAHQRHHAGWTGNPSLFRRDLARQHPWPDTDWSEARYGRDLRDAGYAFAYLGSKTDAPRVTHHGVRTEQSHGY